MSAKEYAGQMAAFLRLLAAEIEADEKLAEKLYQPFFAALPAPKKRRAEKKSPTRATRVPEGFDPFTVYASSGELGLRVALDRFEEPAVFKAILDHFALDTTRSYARWQKKSRFTDLIVERVKAIAEKGKEFTR